MNNAFQKPNGLILVGDLARAAEDDRPLREAYRQNELSRVRRGAYVPATIAKVATRDERYDLRIGAVVGTRRSRVIVSHYSAARLWRLPIVNPWPKEVHLTVEPESGRRSKNGVLVHRSRLHSGEIAERGSFLVTSLVRTLTDLARVAPFRDAVAAIDHALHERWTTKEALLVALAEDDLAWGQRRAIRAIEFASPLAKLPGESFSRVLMHELGFPAPELQHDFARAIGGRHFADFWWDGIRLIGEFDGKGKYQNLEYTQGQTAMDVFWAEKQRENELGEHDVRVRRWVWRDLELVQPFVERLESAGLRRGRPGAQR
jgi:hypothetical protein